MDPVEEETPASRPRRQQARRAGPRKPKVWWEAVDPDTGDPRDPDPAQAIRLHERSMNLCLWHLGRWPRTRHQLTDALTRKGVPDEITGKVLDRLEELGYLNDRSFAENTVRSRTSQKKGRNAVAAELRRKGVDAETTAAALEDLDPDTEAENARALAERKVRTLGRVEPRKQVERVAGMLMRRGYAPGLAWEAARAAVTGHQMHLEDDDVT